MNIIKGILVIIVFFLRVYVIIKTGYLLFVLFDDKTLEIPREFYLLLSYMVFEMYLFKSFDNTEDVDIYKEKTNE